MLEQKPLERIHVSRLATIERALMVWIAKRLPGYIRPDHMTTAGLVGALMCGVGFVASNAASGWLWLTLVGLVLNWAGDSLDGNLARVRGTERPQYGFFVDHISDVVSQLAIFLGLAASPHVRFESGCLLLMSYWIAALYTFIRALSARVFQISYYGIGPTEIRIGLVVYVLSLLTIGPLPISTRFGVLTAMDLIAWTIFALVVISFVALSWSEATRLAIVDRPSDSRPRGDRSNAEPTLVMPDTQPSR